jgi:hypothetical protein
MRYDIQPLLRTKRDALHALLHFIFLRINGQTTSDREEYADCVPRLSRRLPGKKGERRVFGEFGRDFGEAAERRDESWNGQPIEAIPCDGSAGWRGAAAETVAIDRGGARTIHFWRSGDFRNFDGSGLTTLSEARGLLGLVRAFASSGHRPDAERESADSNTGL